MKFPSTPRAVAATGLVAVLRNLLRFGVVCAGLTVFLVIRIIE